MDGVHTLSLGLRRDASKGSPASIIGEGHRGSSIRFRPSRRGLKQNRTLEGAVVHYLCRQRGGRFSVWQDGKQIQLIDTRCETPRWTAVPLDTSATAKKLDLRVDRGRVSIFGSALRRPFRGRHRQYLKFPERMAFSSPRLGQASEGLQERGYIWSFYTLDQYVVP